MVRHVEEERQTPAARRLSGPPAPDCARSDILIQSGLLAHFVDGSSVACLLMKLSPPCFSAQTGREESGWLLNVFKAPGNQQ